MRKLLATALCSIGVAGFIGLSERDAAASFTPQCIPGRVIPAPLSTAGSVSNATRTYMPDPERNIGGTGLYKIGNNINNTMLVAANGYTATLAYSFTGLNTEYAYDIVGLYDNYNGCGSIATTRDARNSECLTI